jgi:hypothetical protein
LMVTGSLKQRTHKRTPSLVQARAFIALGAWLALALASCAPAAFGGVQVLPSTSSQPSTSSVVSPLVLTSAPANSVTEFAQEFVAPLERAGVSLEVAKANAFTYSGEDDKAFFQAVDLFYTQHPGFCPVEGGFLTGAKRNFMTLAADVAGVNVWAFAYDLSSKPKFRGAFIPGKSSSVLKVKPCQTKSGS